MTHYRYEGLRFDLKSGALGAAIKVGEFNQLGKHLTLRIDRSEKKGSQLHGIFVENEDSKGMTVAATAEQGRFLATDDPDKILFRLTKGRLVQNSPKFATPRTLAFDSYDLPVSLPVIDQFRRRAAGETDELYLHELWRLGYGGGASTQIQRVAAEAHFNFRMVEVVMMFMLPLLAIALAVPPKRSSSALGIFVSILIVVAYHKVNQYADRRRHMAGSTRRSVCGDHCWSSPRSSSGCTTCSRTSRAGSRSARSNGSSPALPSASAA